MGKTFANCYTRGASSSAADALYQLYALLELFDWNGVGGVLKAKGAFILKQHYFQLADLLDLANATSQLQLFVIFYRIT